ncbi:hypothetical protein HOLleu_13200 [Holothuria leucospilota]|uniref:MARVEL domain-containing protein n=1 Tax=Holothuria leucospilota TaxID=206669 RepID=A0A9Q1CCU6_HOLLE|nr:hypothetical protein HOLleu_13200 [Holothuria leucospilota]
MADTEAMIYPSQEYEIPTGLAYLKLPEAILEITEAVMMLATIIAVVATPDRNPEEEFYDHLVQTSAIFLVITSAIILLYVTGLVRKVPIPWSMLELFYCAIAAIVTMTMAAHVAANTEGKAGLILASVFAFLAMIVYFCEMFYAIRAWRRSIIKVTLEAVEQGRMEGYSYKHPSGTQPQI